MADTIVTPECRFSYPNVFRARQVNNVGEPKYSISLLFPKGADLSKLKQAAEAAAREKWGKDLPKNLRSPFLKAETLRDNASKPQLELEDGMVVIRASSKQRPGLVDASMQDIIDESQFYAGCYGRASLRAFCYEQQGNRGVSFGLQNVQKLRDGEPLAGRTRPQDDFEPVADAGGGTSSDSLFE